MIDILDRFLDTNVVMRPRIGGLPTGVERRQGYLPICRGLWEKPNAVSLGCEVKF